MSLYDEALRRMRERAAAEFRSTAVGQILGEVDRLRRRGTAGRSELLRLARNLSRLSSRSALRSEIERTEIGKLIGTVDRYARRGLKEAVLDEMLSALGPIGSLMGMFLRPQGRQVASVNRELRAAADLLKAFGYRVEPPERGKAAEPAKRAAESEINRSRKFLESLGFKVEPPPPERRQPARPRRSPGNVGTVVVEAGGIEFHVAPNDPLLTGEWVQVESSNVYAIAFIWNDAKPTRGTLRVRFKNHRKGAKSPRGPAYHYYDVHPGLFQDFRKSASKGRWVWDHLRIRGTVSGHRYRYMLTMLSSDGYVPRQATRLGGEEWFLKRSVKSRAGNTYTSELEDQFVQFWQARKGSPNRGNTGRPNRGGPNRGR